MGLINTQYERPSGAVIWIGTTWISDLSNTHKHFVSKDLNKYGKMEMFVVVIWREGSNYFNFLYFVSGSSKMQLTVLNL